MNADDIWVHIRPPGASSVLATIISVEGHAYRKEGAAMVLYPTGDSAGMISPGCLEEDLAARVPDVLEKGQPELVRYNMMPEEDAIWGEAVGCSGKITVLLEPLAGELLRRLLEAKRRLAAGETVVLERRGSGCEISYRLVSEAYPRLARYAGSAIPETAPGDWFYAATFKPRPRLILFGAGRDAPYLCRAAAQIGFRVVVTDWREGLLSPERFPDAAERVAGIPAELAAKLDFRADDFAVVCSHQFKYDRDMLGYLLPAKPAYIGVMGSRKRVSLLFDGLERTPNVHAPVGLGIGAEGPEEIAVSIAAELISVKAAMAAAEKGAYPLENRRFIFGGGTGQPPGRAQAGR